MVPEVCEGEGIEVNEVTLALSGNTIPVRLDGSLGPGEWSFDPPVRLRAGEQHILYLEEAHAKDSVIVRARIVRVLPPSDAPALSRGITGREPMIGGRDASVDE